MYSIAWRLPTITFSTFSISGVTNLRTSSMGRSFVMEILVIVPCEWEAGYSGHGRNPFADDSRSERRACFQV
jgi:hypothetical protein